MKKIFKYFFFWNHLNFLYHMNVENVQRGIDIDMCRLINHRSYMFVVRTK